MEEEKCKPVLTLKASVPVFYNVLGPVPRSTLHVEEKINKAAIVNLTAMVNNISNEENNIVDT